MSANLVVKQWDSTQSCDFTLDGHKVETLRVKLSSL